jgi:prepilin-type N-terminal cleavage/methylation domain-containing protein
MLNRHHPTRGRSGFTLIEIMLVVAILALLATLAIPNYVRSRKRSQAVRLLDDLRAVDNAMDMYAAEYHRAGNEPITDADIDLLKRYIKDRTHLFQSLPNDMFGNEIVMVDLKTPPRVNIVTFNALSDVAPTAFWAPYTP